MEKMSIPNTKDKFNDGARNFTLRHDKKIMDKFTLKAKKDGFRISTLLRHWINVYVNQK